MVAPVIMAFGSPAQQQRFLPNISIGRSLVVPGIFRAGSRLGSGILAHPRSARGR